MSSWVGNPSRPPYVIPRGSAGLKKDILLCRALFMNRVLDFLVQDQSMHLSLCGQSDWPAGRDSKFAAAGAVVSLSLSLSLSRVV